MGTLFKNGTIITAADEYQGDVLVEGEVISVIGRDLPADGHEVVDCSGKYLMPGGIDVHTHLDLPFGGTISNDDFETGHIAAAFGGTTAHIDFVIQPIGGSLMDGLKEWRRKAEKAHIDYGFHMAITDLRDDVMEEIPSMVDEGITSLKVFMAYKGVFMVDDDTLFGAMQVAADNGMIVMVHAENGHVESLLTPQLIADGKTDPKFHAQSRPPEIEGEATNRAVVPGGHDQLPALRGAYDLRTRDSGPGAWPRDRLSSDGRDLHAVSLPDGCGTSGRARIRRLEVRLLAAHPHHL